MSGLPGLAELRGRPRGSSRPGRGDVGIPGSGRREPTETNQADPSRGDRPSRLSFGSQNLGKLTGGWLIGSLVILVLAGCGKPETAQGQAYREFYLSDEVTVNYSHADLGYTKVLDGCTVESYGEVIMEAARTSPMGQEETVLDATYYGEREFTKQIFIEMGLGETVREIVDGRWQTDYEHGFGGIPRSTTTDLTTNVLVAETKNIGKQGDGAFTHTEIGYDETGEKVFESLVTRDATTGLIVEEEVKFGANLQDYHQYELTVGRWPVLR